MKTPALRSRELGFYDRETIFMRTDYQTTDTLDSLPEFCSPGDLSKVLPAALLWDGASSFLGSI